MTKSQLMKKAWQFAKGIAEKLGVGKASEYIAEGLRRAWALFGSQLRKTHKETFAQTTSLKGMMTEKQERFIASLIRQGKYVANNSVLGAFQISSLRSRITKQQASDLISELLNA